MSNQLFILYALAGGLFLLAFAFAILSVKSAKINSLVVNFLLAIGAVFGIIGSISQLSSDTAEVSLLNLSSNIPNFTFTVSVDYLSAFFLLALNLLLLAVAIYTPKYMTHYEGHYSLSLFNLLNAAFVCSLFIVFTAHNLVSFYIFWEIMSAVSYFLANYEHDMKETQKASTTYIIMTHIAASFMLIAFLIIFYYTGSMLLPENLTFLAQPMQVLLAVLLLIGFGTKAGLVPLHIWLPQAHPAAPSNVSALMSGIMIKTAIYGFIRFIFIPLALPLWFSMIILSIGIITAISGIAYAAVENNYKRLLPYSSIENIGIITTAFGTSLVAAAIDRPYIAALALMAALFHALNHTIVKGGLFLSAGCIQYATHTKEIPDLGGLAKKMPYTAGCVLILSLAISAVVPFATFSSEWLSYQSLISLITATTPLLDIVLIIVIALLAMTGALAVLTFVKFFGITFLGTARSEHAREAHEAPLSMRISLTMLIAVLAFNSFYPAFIVNMLNKTISTVTTLPAVTTKYVYNLPTYTDGITMGNYDPAIVIILLAVLIAFAVIGPMILAGKLTKRYYNTWDCGFTHQTPKMQYSSTAYANPISIIFKILYQPEFKCGNENFNPYNRTKLTYEQHITKPVVRYLYTPLINLHKKLSLFLTEHLQNGYIQQYLLYIMLILLVFIAYNSIL